MVNLMKEKRNKYCVTVLMCCFLTFTFVNILINSLELATASAAAKKINPEETIDEICGSYLKKAKKDLEDIISKANEAETEARKNGASPSTIKNLKIKWRNKIKKVEMRVESEENLLETRIAEMRSGLAEEAELRERVRLIREETERMEIEMARIKAEEEARLLEEEELWEEVERMQAAKEMMDRLKKESMSASSSKNAKQKQKKELRKLRRKTDSEEIQRRELEEETRNNNILIMRARSGNIWRLATYGLSTSNLNTMESKQ